MDTFALKNFTHLAVTLSFSRTSRECNISPSALSRQIKRLEEEIGEPLFIRDNRSVQLTPAGVLMRDYAVEMLDRLAGVREAFESRAGTLRGEISLYCSVTACYSILPDIIARFRKTYPEIHLKLQTGDEALAVQRVQEGDADIAVAARPEGLSEGLQFRTITRTPLVFIAPSFPCAVAGLVERRPIPWAEVPMVLSERGLARKRVDTWFHTLGLAPRIYAQVSGNEAILAMVGLGCGVGVVPELVVEKGPALSVRVIEVDPELDPYTVGACVARRRLASAHIRAFWESVQQEGVPRV